MMYGHVIAADGSVAPFGGWNCVSPCHEIVSCKTEDAGAKSRVTFTLASAAWGGRDDRRPGWLTVMRGGSVLWPSVPQDDRYSPARLNIGWFQPYRFGRLIVR